MSLRGPLDTALDAHRAGGADVVVADSEGARVSLDLARADDLAARVHEVRAGRDAARDLRAEASRLVAEVHALGAPLRAVEVDPGLGGAVLRTSPDARQRWFDVRVEPTQTRVQRMRRGDDGQASAEPFELTREQLADLLDTL